MQLNPYMFRGYDLRGIAGKDLTPEIVEHLGKVFGTFLKREKITQAVVGRDSRATSPSYSARMKKGLHWAGIDTIDIGLNLVGTFYWSQYYLRSKGGVYVSASHNPAEYNGFKFANDFSETLAQEGMQELRRMAETDDMEKGSMQGKDQEADIRDAYFNDLLARVPFKKPYRVVVDASCSTAGVIAPELLRRAGCEVIESNCDLNPEFPLGTPDPTSSALASRLSKKVLEDQADIGFSYDVDGDRVGIVDDKGTIIWTDVLVAIFARDVLSTYPGATIMYNTLCSKAVEETILRYGGKPFMWRTGHSFLKKKNQEVKAAFIGELSGHFFFSADFYNHDDGLYATLRLLRYLAATNQSLSEILASLPAYISSPEIKVFCADDKKAELINKLGPIVKREFPSARIIDDERAGDGVRADFPDSMFVIRYSQNGPYLTVKFEAKIDAQYQELRSRIRTLLGQYEEIDWNSSINVNTEFL